MPAREALEALKVEVRLGFLTAPVRLGSLTAEGLVVSGFELARVGDAISVQFPSRRRLRCHVVDTSGHETTLKFDDPLSEFDGLLAAA